MLSTTLEHEKMHFFSIDEDVLTGIAIKSIENIDSIALTSIKMHKIAKKALRLSRIELKVELESIKVGLNDQLVCARNFVEPLNHLFDRIFIPSSEMEQRIFYHKLKSEDILKKIENRTKCIGMVEMNSNDSESNFHIEKKLYDEQKTNLDYSIKTNDEINTLFDSLKSLLMPYPAFFQEENRS